MQLAARRTWVGKSEPPKKANEKFEAGHPDISRFGNGKGSLSVLDFLVTRVSLCAVQLRDDLGHVTYPPAHDW